MSPSDKDPNKPIAPDQSDRSLATGSSFPDSRLLAETIKALNISRKNVNIYPPGHEQTERSLDQIVQFLKRIGEHVPVLTIGVAKDTLLFDHAPLDPKSTVFKEFALALSRLNIAVLTIAQGIEKRELEQFHQMLSTPEEGLKTEGAQNIIDQTLTPHITIETINYGRLHLTAEKEITQPNAATKMPSTNKIWSDFVSHIIKGDIAGKGNGILPGKENDIAPSILAKLINQQEIPIDSAISGYRQSIHLHLKETSPSNPMQLKILHKFNELLNELQPELKKQFLSVTFQQISSTTENNPKNRGCQNILDGFTDEMVIEMLKQANQEGKEISPSLLTMISELSGIEGLSQEIDITKADKILNSISSDQMATLFEREDYENYVDEEYDSLLSKLKTPKEGLSIGRLKSSELSTGIPSMESPTDGLKVQGGDFSPYEVQERFKISASKREDPISASMFLTTLEDSHLEIQIRKMIIAFIDQPIAVADYSLFTEKLTENMSFILQVSEFKLLHNIMTTLKRHIKTKDQEFARLAEKSLQHFYKPSFIIYAVNRFEDCLSTRPVEGFEFLNLLGERCIPKIIDLYVKMDDSAEMVQVVNLLKQFGEPAVAEAVRRLDADKTTTTVKILRLLNQIGTAAILPHIKPFLYHEEKRFRNEALSILLHFKDPEGPELLRRQFNSETGRERKQAVFLAGHYRVAEVAGDLVSMLKMNVFFKSDYNINDKIIKALGRIGDPLSIPVLEKLARSKWALHPSLLLEQKVTVFESLENYPRGKLTKLFAIGLRAKEKEINAICQILMAESLST